MAETLRRVPVVPEVDVATSADGVLFLMHDDTLERTTDGRGRADALPWAGLRALRLRDDEGRKTAFHPPTFAEALAWARDRTLLQVDFKSTTRYADVVGEVRRQGAEGRVIYIAYTVGQARALHRLAPRSMISVVVEEPRGLEAVLAAGIPADRVLAFTGVADPRPRLFQALDSRGVEVIFGTLGGRGIDAGAAASGDDRVYAELSRQGVDILATDRPLAAHAALVREGRAVREGVCGWRREGAAAPGP